ncbi:sigma-54 dependent transcriptional regulator [Pontibacter sp. G13]|uniref:sigma-54-dependent transcriptional regulator n=1 Tax=Pontibacter sp. G13 TaxID=3074898 RepID=UPI002889445A|nr:sigma-54 dependent transcriptional regulator [Pontibacter sp. G13]WNJ17271.1 sigma-54 dependent transcriptional regulator [Pontibacter sp. G13]
MTEKVKIFVVEDDDWYRELVGFNLELNPDYEVTKFANATDALKELSQLPEVVTLDYRLPDMEGEEALKRIKDFDPNIEVIIVSEQDKIDTAVNLLKLGAYDYIPKSDDIRDRLLNTVNNIRKTQKLQSRIKTLEREVGQKYEFEKSIIGQSPAIRRVFNMLEKATKTNITVLVTGETGTGKELAAKAIHYNSRRKDKPFVPVNMAAIPSELVESELFGHEKGAFTGAQNRRIGKFEEAHGGTLFLDEIGEMEQTFQAKLLRALQEKEITRVGSNKIVKVDCRIVVATNRNLLEEVKAGRFREDLYYRLYGLPIELPPLREREKDIILLANFFLDRFCEENEMEPYSLSAETKRKLLSYRFPGNIRELKSVIELAAVMANDPVITPDILSFSQTDALPEVMSDEMTMRDYTYRIIDIYLQKYDNNVKLIADKLDMGASTIYRMLKERKEEKTGASTGAEY